jgi:uncharacterized membrane protein
MVTSVERMGRESERTVVLIAYVLHLVGAIAAVTSLIGLVLNYVRRDRFGGVYDTHHRWMIRSFWWSMLWAVIGFCTTFLLIGWAILGLVWLWYVYRHLRGLVALLNGEPMPS